MENSNPIFSSSSSTPKEYDVFLSFRGEDTRKNFTGHLRDALRQKGFDTFFDDDKLGRGKKIATELLKAIADSDCSIVVLSENYASSSWCLTELAMIVECMGTSDQVLPIFYHVDPGDVRNQTGSYGEAFKKHEEDAERNSQKVQSWGDALKSIVNLAFKKHKEDPKHNSEKVKSWRKALKTVGNLSGWHVTKETDESKFIEEFIIQISRKLEGASLNISQDLSGIISHLEKFESSTVSPSPDTVQFIGIWGMSGIGKTTLAIAYYSRNFYKFDGSSFQANVRETCEKRENGLVYLQTQLLSNILKDDKIKIDNSYRGINMIKRKLRHKKVLIVLDDVNELAQLEALAYQKDWFGSGSIIIVTTKDEYVLRKSGINAVYEAKILDGSEAIELFSRKAFRSSEPPEEYKVVCEQVIKYAKGLPLALSVLGSRLCNGSIIDFEEELSRLKESQNEEISRVLKVGFKGLEKVDQKIFLDIACFFNEYKKDHVIEILYSSGVSKPENGINSLIEKSLLRIDQQNRLHMHGLLQEMGKEIVLDESRSEPGRRSRIWDVVDFYHILENETGTDNVEAIVTSVDGSKKLPSLKAISKMKKLRLLMIFNPDFLCGNGSSTPYLEYLSNELELLQWDTFPCKGFPSSFRPYKLAKLKLFDSSIKNLWSKHVKPLCNLKIIDLSNSWNLTKFEDFKVVPNLERLILEGIKLSKIDDSITSLKKLIILSLASCTSLKKLPKKIKGMESLQILNLYDCPQLCELPEDFGHLKSLKEVDVRDSGIRHFPSSIFLIENLKVLCDEEVAKSSLRKSIINPHPIGRYFLPHNFRFLRKLDLSNCNLSDGAFPEHFGKLVSLEELSLSKNPFSVLPPHIKGLSKLTYLNLMYCEFLRYLSPDQLPSSLGTLRVDYCTSLNTLLDPLEPCHLQCSTYCVDCTELVKRRGGEMTALASLKRYIQNPIPPTRPFDIVIPGSDIPAWFTSRSSGPSVNIKLDGNNKWMGIAFLVCFCANSSDVQLSCMVRVRGKNKKCKLVTKTIHRRSENHIWLSYSPRSFYLENGCYGLQFSFYANESNNSCCGPCGVRLVFEEDIKKSNQITTQNCNQSPEDEDGEHHIRSTRSNNKKGIFGSMLVATLVAFLVVALRHKSH